MSIQQMNSFIEYQYMYQRIFGTILLRSLVWTLSFYDIFLMFGDFDFEHNYSHLFPSAKVFEFQQKKKKLCWDFSVLGRNGTNENFVHVMCIPFGGPDAIA